jgi:hypothetical protein
MQRAPKRLILPDLAPYLLLRNGNYLYKVPWDGGSAVLKVYVGSRGALGRAWKSLANVLLYGQTSYAARTRRRVERECLDLWARHGFRTFRVFDEVEVVAPGCPPGGYLLLEYVERPRLGRHVADPAVPLAERLSTWRRFLAEWGRRHALAVSLREPRLVHENGDGKHVMLMEDGGFLWFDFEMVYRSRSTVRRHVAHEIVQYLWQIARGMPEAERDALYAETVRHYPARERMRLLRRIDRLRARAKKPTSKYRVAERLRRALEAAGPP